MSPRISASDREQYIQGRREQILDAALDVFGKKGFAGANVSDIAETAGVGKGTLYLYFRSKEEIFSTIVRERSFFPRLAQLSGSGSASLEEVLTRIAEEYLDYAHQYLPIFRMAIADTFLFPEQSEQVYREIVQKGSQVIADYLQDQARQGKIRSLADPVITGRAFMGMLSTYVISQELLGGKHLEDIAVRDWIHAVVCIFLHGVEP